MRRTIRHCERLKKKQKAISFKEPKMTNELTQLSSKQRRSLSPDNRLCRNGNGAACQMLSYLLPARVSEQEGPRWDQGWDCLSLPAGPSFLAHQHALKIK